MNVPRAVSAVSALARTNRPTRLRTGLYDSATVYRADDGGREGCKRLLCGLCVRSEEATDPLKVSGSFCCEHCCAPVGREEAFEQADALLAKVCSVAARHRRERLTGVTEPVPLTPLLLDDHAAN